MFEFLNIILIHFNIENACKRPRDFESDIDDIFLMWLSWNRTQGINRKNARPYGLKAVSSLRI